MTDQLIALIIDESKWLTMSMGLALFLVTLLLYRTRHSGHTVRLRIYAAMNLFFGVMVGTMAFGHLLAVSTKLGLGTLEGSASFFYGIGIVLAIPAWWLIYHVRELLSSRDHRRRTLVLNGWLAATLLALGPQNFPLAAPAILNVGYHFHSRQYVGWAIVCLAVAMNVGLFIGSLVFLASGQSFEQFRGIE